MRELIFKVEEENLNFFKTLPHSEIIVVVPKNAETADYWVCETDEHPTEIITQEEFEKRGYHLHNCGGWVTVVP